MERLTMILEELSRGYITIEEARARLVEHLDLAECPCGDLVANMPCRCEAALELVS